MKNQRKTFLSGLFAIVLGTSCCWISTIAVWTGGVGLLSVLAKYSGKIQVTLLPIGILLIAISIYKFLKEKKIEN